MTEKINWKVHRKRLHNRYYAMYRDQLAFFVVPSGDLAISTRAWRELGEPEAAVLLSDETGTMVGVRAASLGDENAYKLNVSNSPNLVYIAAKTFSEAHPTLKGLTDTSKVWLNGYIDGKTLVVNLNHRPSVVK